jgi:putative oxygen-independent coproporphyrinogen III oxidase
MTNHTKTITETPLRFTPRTKQNGENGTLQRKPFTTLPPLSLYVHIPWCVKKCPYCDFNSHENPALNVVSNDELQARYVEALLSDVEQALPNIWGRSIQTIFIGGGTPSLFSERAINQLLSGLRARLNIAPNAEITLEANPATFERAKFKGFYQAGITRLSIGVQSFNDDFLHALGRVHSGNEARSAIETAAQTFDTFNLDLMFALPHQTQAQVLADLETALSFSPPHLSYYHLTLEPNTVFAKYPPQGLPSDDEGALFYDAIRERLAAQGFEHYEISAWAKPKHQSRHNLNYWQFGDYLGIGAGAHSKLSNAGQTPQDHASIVRQTRTYNPMRYIEDVANCAHIKTNQNIINEDLPLEFLMNILRLKDGVPASFFEERTGLSPLVLQSFIDKASARGWLEPGIGRIQTSELGRLFLNDVLLLI